MIDGRLAGRRALVTGAADGIGLGIARRFAAEGAHVAAVDRDAAGLDAVEGGIGEESNGIETGFGDILGLGDHGEVLRKG